MPALGAGGGDPLRAAIADAAAQEPAESAAAAEPVARRVRVGYVTWRKRLRHHGLAVGP